MEERSTRRKKMVKGTQRDESRKPGMGEDRDGERHRGIMREGRRRMISRLPKPLHAGSEASKCTPTISILTQPPLLWPVSPSLSSGMEHRMQET